MCFFRLFLVQVYEFQLNMFKVLMLVMIFQLSDELKRLARMESQFRGEYLKLRAQVPERLGTGDGFFLSGARFRHRAGGQHAHLLRAGGHPQPQP